MLTKMEKNHEKSETQTVPGTFVRSIEKKIQEKAEII